MRFPARSARSRRPVPILVSAVLTAVTAVATTACGPDLSKQNFPRTTVPAKTASDPGTDGGSALTVTALRTVDPCGLLDSGTLGDLGKIVDGELSPYALGECRNVVTDAGGKRIALDLQLADIVTGSNPSGTVEGLPLSVDKIDDTTCNVDGITSKSDGSGISVHATYKGG
ncbi:hypothetical protein FNH05_37570, partial [Amycolatopsis rhizosphaerae]